MNVTRNSWLNAATWTGLSHLVPNSTFMFDLKHVLVPSRASSESKSGLCFCRFALFCSRKHPFSVTSSFDSFRFHTVAHIEQFSQSDLGSDRKKDLLTGLRGKEILQCTNGLKIAPTSKAWRFRFRRVLKRCEGIYRARQSAYVCFNIVQW